LWIERSRDSAGAVGSLLEQAISSVYQARYAFAGGAGGQDRSRFADERLESLGRLGRHSSLASA
jgi:hypothetical protein